MANLLFPYIPLHWLSVSYLFNLVFSHLTNNISLDCCWQLLLVISISLLKNYGQNKKTWVWTVLVLWRINEAELVALSRRSKKLRPTPEVNLPLSFTESRDLLEFPTRSVESLHLLLRRNCPLFPSAKVEEQKKRSSAPLPTIRRGFAVKNENVLLVFFFSVEILVRAQPTKNIMQNEPFHRCPNQITVLPGSVCGFFLFLGSQRIPVSLWKGNYWDEIRNK